MKLHAQTIQGAATLGLALLAAAQVDAEDWPMFGRDGTRNAVSPEAAPPTDWDIGKYDEKSGKRVGSRNLCWSAPLGTQTFGDPVVADGQAWVGINNSLLWPKPGRADKVDASVLAAFDARNGKPLYRYVSPRLLRQHVHDWPSSAMACSPLIEGDRMWFTTNRCETVCLDLGPLKRGDGQPREVWKVDMMKEFGVFFRGSPMSISHFCSIASYKDLIYVITGNGAQYHNPSVPAPQAPSLICFKKDSGEVVWQDNLPGANILDGQWASPLVIESGERVQVVAPQGDGWVRSFDARTGKLLWKFDMNFKTSSWSPIGKGERNTILATPVAYDGRVYIASGQHAEHGEGPGRLVCVDPTKSGDISSELAVDGAGQPLPDRREQAADPAKGERAVPNPNSGLLWEYVQADRDNDGEIGFEEAFHRTYANVAIKDDLLVVGDTTGLIHCLDAKTGKAHWTHDSLGGIFASPLIADDKVYVANDDGRVLIFRLAVERQAPLAEISMDASVYTSPIFANGVLYIATQYTLFAIVTDQAEDPKPTASGSWPQWRGPNRDNRSSDTGLRSSWPEEGPPLVWRIEGLGDGIASLAVSDGRIFTSSTYGNIEYAVAFDEVKGERIWATPIGPAVQENPLMRWLSQRTPTLDGNRAYVFTNDGWLVCLDAKTGTVRWRVSYPDEFGMQRGKWGFCDRPLIDGDQLIGTPGGSKATIAALDKNTGKVMWSTLLESRERHGYAATLAIETDGLRQYVVVLDQGIASFAAEDGRFLWRYDGVSSPLANTYTPLVLPDGLLCPNGYGTGIARLKLTRVGDEVHATEQFLVRPKFDPFEDSTALVDGNLYAFETGGITACFDISDGKRKWRDRTSDRGKAAITYADRRLYVRWTDGTIALVEVNPQAYVEKGRFVLPDPRKSIGVTFPVVAGGRLYIRDNDRLYCYDVMEHPSGTKAPSTSLVQWTPPEDVGAESQPTGARVPNAIFVPTPQDVVEKMLAEAHVGKDDVVYDLGSGDGRIVIEAARKYQCRAIGLELDPELVALSRQRAKEAKVDHLVTIKEADIFTTDFSEATVVAVYLHSELLSRLSPKLRQLAPGARIVSHQFEIPDYPPERTLTVESQETGAKHTIYIWTLDAKAGETPRSDTDE